MMMKRRNRGFKLKRKITRLFKWVTRHNKNSCQYEKLDGPTIQKNQAFSKLCKWGKTIKRGILKPGSTPGYIRLGDTRSSDPKPGRVPKGHLAVYVGEPEGDTRRVLVPVMFVNHPLFEKLLKEAEKVYGYDHPGRITIPCPISDFENVKTRIAATDTKCGLANVKCLSILRH